MKKAYIIHGWGFNPGMNWYPWLKKELEQRGYKVMAFDMPETDNPKIEKWVSYLKENIKKVDEQTYFIGHSIGCQTIMRFLEKLHKHKKIGGCVFVAPWLDLIGLEPEEMTIAHPWINTKMDFERILDHCDNFMCIFSDNDPYVSLDEAGKFKEKLRAKIMRKKKEGHFESSEQIPEILEFLK